MPELPAPLRVLSPFPFVGRSAELEKLRLLLPRADGEGGRVVLLAGEPGSGKSRLVREFAAEAAASDALVLYGACDSVVQTPFGPFSQALESLPVLLPADELREVVGASGAELSRLLPYLHDVLGPLPEPMRGDPDTERLRLHAAVTELLERLGRTRAVVLVIEDGHWADLSTLHLLRHLAQTASARRLLLLGTFRDTEADVPLALADTLAELRRREDVVRLRVGALSSSDISEFVKRAAHADSADVPALADAFSELTGGNAFLMCELWRALLESDLVQMVDGELRLAGDSPSGLTTPESVREVVSARLARLQPSTTDLLELASAAGTEFAPSLLSESSGLTEQTLVAALDEATRAGVIVELPGRRLAYRFSHELVRRAIYDRVSGVRRAELHLRIGEALEEASERSARALGDLAHHFTAATALDGVERAVKYDVLAARAASDSVAFDEAGDLLRAALDLGIADPRDRVEVLLELGMARHRAGRAPEALEAFAEAAQIARDRGDPDVLARAAAGYEVASWRPGMVAPEALEILEEAAVALGSDESELRVELLAGLARALDMRGEHDRAATVRRNAIDLARRLDDRPGLATVLVRSYWSRGATPLAEILRMVSEARAIGEELGDTEMQAEAMSWRVPSFVAMADIPSARAELADMREMAEITRQPFMLHVAEHYGAAIALSDGQLAAAEDMAARSEEAGRTLTGRDASGTYGIQMFSLRREQGRLAELASVVRILASGDGRLGGPWRPGLACLQAELGMQAEARRELERVAHEGIDQYRESLWLAALTYLTDACTAVDEQATAALLWPELEPLAGRNVMIGHLVAYYGSADRYLGMLATTLGEWELAEAHFERALGANSAMGARTWLARTQYEYARMLRRAGGARVERATALFAEAARLASEIGMLALAKRIETSGAGVAATGALPDDLSAREAQILRLVARGLSNREIGAELFISEHTAANHVRSILRKTGCANRTEAASYAHRNALADA